MAYWFRIIKALLYVVIQEGFLRVMRVCGYIQLVTPREVAIAVRIEITI